MSNKTNKFRRAIHHLKSDQIDDRMSVLEAAPTNSTLNLMTVEPSVQVTSPKTETSLGLDFDKGNDDDDGKDTSGIFESDGTILTVEPPGDTSYILGPMASMWYAWGNFTRIGYIAQDTRRMVNLGSITGELGSWNGSADDFTSYGQLTLAQAEWFRTIGKKDDADNDTPNYRAFYPGPPSSAADEFGRYLAVIVGEAKMKEEGGIRSTSNPKNAPEDATTQFSGLMYQQMLDRAVAHGLRRKRAEEMTEGELAAFLEKQDALQADIDKFSKQQKEAEAEARRIAIQFGVDVALTLFGGALIKGVGKGLQLGVKGIQAANRARSISKAAKLIKAADKVDDATALAKATQGYNQAQKAAEAAKAADKAAKAAQKAQKAFGTSTSPYPQGYKGKIRTGKLTGTNLPGTTPTPPKGQLGSSTSPYRQGYKGNIRTGKLTGTNLANTTKIPANKVPKRGSSGRFRETDLNIKGPDGNVIAKNVKNSQTGQWERINKPGSNATRAELAKWERLENQVSNKAWQNYLKTGELNPSPIGNPLRAMNPFVKGGLRSGPTALAKKYGIPVALGTGIAAYGGATALSKGIDSLSKSEAKSFVSDIKSAIENVVSKASSPEQVTNSIIQLASQLFPQEDKTAVRMFMQYLTGNAPENAGDIVPEADQESAWKGMKINKGGGITVGGPMVNVFGGEPTENLTVDKNGNAVFKFNFAPRTNKEEFAGAPKGRWSSGYKDFLTKFEPVTQYMADLTPNFGKTKGDKVKGAIAGTATNIFKTIDKITPDGSKLGGIKTARDLEGDIKIPMSKLKTLNPNAYKHLQKSLENKGDGDQASAFPDQNLGGLGAKSGDKVAWGKKQTPLDKTMKQSQLQYKRIMGQAYAAGESGDPAAIEAFTQKYGMSPDDYREEGTFNPDGSPNLNSPVWQKLQSKKKSKVQVAHYKPQGKLISEERIWLREIKKPVKVPELQKKFKGIKPKVRKKGDYKVVGAGLMKDNIAPPEFSPTRENRLWRKYEVKQNERASQEKKNQVLELIGEGDHQWNHMLGNERWRSASQMKKFYGDHDYLYDYYYGGKKHKVLRKEGLEKDFLLFIEDENGFKDTILQTELNELLAEERDKEDFKEYYMKETEQKEREKNFDRATRLKSIVGRIKRGDIGPEYPNEPPPKMVNGWHPKFGKKYKHDKLDPISARSMPPTGDPEIDANVEKARNKPK